MNRNTLLLFICFTVIAGCSKENNSPATITTDALAEQVKLTRVKETYPNNGAYYQTSFRFESTNNEISLIATAINNQNGLRYYKQVFTHDQDGNTKEIKYSTNPNDTLNLNTQFKFFRNTNGVNKIEHYSNGILTTIYSFTYPTAQQINYTAYTVDKYDTSYVEMKLNSNLKTTVIAAKNVNKTASSTTPVFSKYADTLEYNNSGISRVSFKGTSSYLNFFFDTTIYINRYIRSTVMDSSVYKLIQFTKGKDGQSLPDFQNASMTYSFTRYHSLFFLTTFRETPSIQPFVFSVAPYEKYISSSYVRANGVVFLNPNNNIETREYFTTFSTDGRISKLTSAFISPGTTTAVYSEYFY
jgi:hypothetical protein